MSSSKPPRFLSNVESSTSSLLQLVYWTQCELVSALTPRAVELKRKKLLCYTYETVHAPPATVFLHPLQFQMPTECRFTVFLPQKVQTYRACCVISIFLTCFRRDAPYLYSLS